jgi:paired amphipathic helix protein Sin3a
VLNDEWVSHPTWASEESGFLTHKKNSFEETLHRSEEERHEYQTHIDAITRTIAVLDPINTRITEMKSEERAHFRLGPELGGSSVAVYQKTIKKVYGREHWHEIYMGLQENPVTAVPTVLSRLKQKSEEWRRQQREWNRTWREVDAKNFYKALDHQGITFKANDKKNITAKFFVQDIEAVKAAQLKERELSKSVESLNYQLDFELQDQEVLLDTFKMIYSFLDHSTAIYGPSERRSVEQFLKSFLPMLFSSSSLELTVPSAVMACPPEVHVSADLEESAESSKSVRELNGRRSAPGTHASGVPAGDLRKRLLKTVQEGVPSRAVKQSRSSGSASPVATSSPRAPQAARPVDVAERPPDTRSKAEDMWIREIPILLPEGGGETGETLVQKRPFFTSTTFYTLLRLLQVTVHICPSQ